MNKRTFFLLTFSIGIAESIIAQDLPKLGQSSLNEFVSAMTLDEKISLLVGAGDEDVAADSTSTAIIGSTRKIVPGHYP